MEKQISEFTEQELRECVRKVIGEVLYENPQYRALLTEGIDIDYDNAVVSFNPNHQDNVDTNDYLYPYFIQNQINGETILSIFERKTNLKGTDGNPLVYALKGLYGWHFSNPQQDIFALLRRFVAVTRCLQGQFDTLILVPSKNQLNNFVFGYLKQIVSFKNSYSSFFEKLMANEVYESYIDLDKLESKFVATDGQRARAESRLVQALERMNTENGGVFSYKYIMPSSLRQAVAKSMRVREDETFAEAINDKNVLVFDDTVTSGKTLSDVAYAIRETFAPKSITFLTLFSPTQGDCFQNIRRNA